ncbi:MAG: diacylglycerol kinase family lipid kinase [Gemmatimonadales bacterium]|nr:diacylglycerol kinase family lipid kinase [Gemmatimonadales bacterium]
MSDIVVLLNAGSGKGKASEFARTLEKLFAEAGREARIELVDDGDRLRQLAKSAVADKCTALVAGGGDGTINTVASVVVGTDIPLGVLPLGTLNHFAKDLRLPTDLEDAARVILAGHTERVDVGQVNERIFLNNSSLGVYPRLVRLRERYQKRGRAKWIAAFWAMLVVLRRHSFLGVRVTADGETLVRRTPFVFVGNNEYRMEGTAAGSRESLAGGQLALYLMNASGRRSLLWLAWQILRGRTQQLRELEATLVGEAEVETRRNTLQVAIDGEVVVEHGPLRYRVRPGALRVFRPLPEA